MQFITPKKIMFSEKMLTGPVLANKKICLSFDDGPGVSYSIKQGPNTLALAQYLQSEGIVASFLW